MDNKNKKYKLYVLQRKYKFISKILTNLQQHISYISKFNLITNVKRNSVLGKLYEINKDINKKYNFYINNELLSNSKNINVSEDLFSYVESWDDIMQSIDSESYNDKNYPFFNIIDELKQIMNEIGYINIEDLISSNQSFKWKNYYDKNTLSIIKEISSIFHPLSFSSYDVEKQTTNFYWRIPTVFQKNDFLENTRELWIKDIRYEKKYIKIEGFFKPDLLNIVIKTSQLEYPYLYKKKKDINKMLETTNFIDNKFSKSYLRHKYVGDIYCLSNEKLFEQLEEDYKQTIELANSTFLRIMKKFISKNTSIKHMFTIIFLLLLVKNDDCIDVACLLFGLTKEKKIGSQHICNIIYNNLSYYLQIKLKKNNNSIKEEYERIKKLSLDDIDYRKQVLSNKNIPDNVKNFALEKIEEMKSNNNEYYKQLTFVKYIIKFPWPSKSDDLFYNSLKNDHKKACDYLTKAEKNLTELSYGHKKAKESLLQTIGQWISNPESRGTSLGLVGPPGVGKTLLAKSISSALDIPFAQITLGGQNDGELLHGHGYTYSGSQPGMIIRKMVEAGKSRCILYFDELDKACSKHGQVNEITSILIHLTDPNMNKTFQDRFFQGIDFPLNKVIMIFSYNDSDLIDPILLDRLKEIKIKPYTTPEKIEIVNEFIFPEIIKNIGFDKNDIKFDKALTKFIIDKYTNEAGVRNIKRKIEEIMLKLNLDKIYSRNLFKTKKRPIKLKQSDVVKILDSPSLEIQKIPDKSEVGIINGLYATSNGDGGIIPIQIYNNLTSSENFEFKLTGNQGKVMKESVQCSYTTAIDHIKRNLDKYPQIKNLDELIKKEFKNGFHIHAPSTSTPKDGPSAGCAFTSAFISRILNKKIKRDIAMTGEIELTGQITKIGGLNYKLLGAKRAGVQTVFIPKENEKDYNEIKKKNPKLFSKKFKIVIVNNIDDIIPNILE